MGHTTQNEIKSICEGYGILIDTGISKAMRNIPSALEIIQEDGVTVRMTAFYEFHFEDIYSNMEF